jgi:integrase
MQQFLDWCVQEGELRSKPLGTSACQGQARGQYPHQVLTDEQVRTLLQAKDRVLSGALLFGLLTGMRSGEVCGLMAEDVTQKGNLGRFIHIRPNALRQLKSKAAEREVPLHDRLVQLLDTSLPT